MAINLVKGQTIDLKKSENDLSTMTIGLGWDVRKSSGGGFLGGLFGKKEEEYDLDAVAFLLDANDKITNLGQEARIGNNTIGLQKSDIIFFNNISAPSGTGPSGGVFGGKSKSDMRAIVNELLRRGEYIVHTGDNLTGDGDGDDEQIIVKLDQVPSRVQKILFLVCIYQGAARNQHFGMLDNAFIRAVDAKGKEMARFSLSGGAEYAGKRSMVFGEVYRRGDEWKFRALGNPEGTDNFVDILRRYLPTS